MGSISPNDEERERKRVRFSAPDDKKPTLAASEVVELRFVRTDSDITHVNSPHPAHLTAKAPFLHQIIPKETVTGWARLRVAVYIHLRSLSYWLDMDGEPNSEERTDVITLLRPFIKGGLCETRDEFVENLKSNLPGLRRCVEDYNKSGKEFRIFKESFFRKDATGARIRNEEFLELHRRMCFLMFVHIDGASFIDDEDPRWEVYVVENEGEFIAYATIYPFSGLKKGRGVEFEERIRVSQVFVAPIWQGMGHGGKLLQVVYKDARQRGAREVSVEDPSRGFRLLRDVTDLRRAYREGILPESGTAAWEEGKQRWEEKIREGLLLTSGQARRCLEVHELRFIDQEDEEAYKKYRLWVKRRLFHENYEVLESFDKEERKTKLVEIYSDYKQEYNDAIARLTKTQHPSEATAAPPEDS